MASSTQEISEKFNANFKINGIYSHSELRDFIENESSFSVKNVAAYSYNRWNKGMNDIHPLLEWLNRGYYKFLDLDYEYNGLVIHHPQGGIPYKMGTWTDGKLSYEGGFKDFKDWKESDSNGVKIIDFNSKVTFESVDKKITQKKMIKEVKEERILFEDGYSNLYANSVLGELLKYKVVGDQFEFGPITYVITDIK
jgi:hypothetical protein